MLEELRRHNALVQERIMKSFGYADTEDFIQKGEDNYDLEKAHQDGDMHPNGKWVWVSSANGGKGDWRTLNGRAHKKHTDTQASNKKQENNNKTNHPQGGSGGISNQTLHNTLRELALTGTIRNLRGVSPKRRGEILDELEKRGFVDGHMQVTRKGTAWLSGLITETPEKPKTNNVPNSNSMTTSTVPVATTATSTPKKHSAFVTKTINKLKEALKYRDISDKHLKKLADAISKDEATAKKIAGVKFPAAGTVGPGLSYDETTSTTPISSSDELVCHVSKSYIDTSRGSSPYTRTKYTIYLKDRHSGIKKQLSFSSSSTGKYGKTASQAKQECVMEALLSYYKNSVYGN